ncbi:MAG: 4-hydroxybenzoate octaprenyltransferase [Acidimicrobiales bacterium]|nr:4-hydroxybenzoate octaprenyltransferase [Hyphomonadaceae bacterium]RZV40095.1 MAG: 4-hydroxybenzoate octaprenyltransferase [Acidimicrobiales bacterium]
MNRDQIIKDSVKQGWVESMPESVRPYLRLSRYDRPIGFWLLALPGWIGLAFASLSQGLGWEEIKYAVLIAIGAVAMRGAGCTYNDIVDRDLDASVERTALRPLPAGTVSLKAAWTWVAIQCGIGAIVLAFFPRLAQIIAVSSLALVAGYPFMKRITFWPQAWLGLTFNWAVLVAFVAKTGAVSPSLLFLYAGLVFWTIGYDTIYACQDKEDDALIGIKSTARLFGDRVKLGVGICYALCVSFLLLTGWVETNHWVSLLAIVPFALHLIWQTSKLDPQDGRSCLNLFKSNRSAALLCIVGIVLAGLL